MITTISITHFLHQKVMNTIKLLAQIIIDTIMSCTFMHYSKLIKQLMMILYKVKRWGDMLYKVHILNFPVIGKLKSLQYDWKIYNMKIRSLFSSKSIWLHDKFIIFVMSLKTIFPSFNHFLYIGRWKEWIGKMEC